MSKTKDSLDYYCQFELEHLYSLVFRQIFLFSTLIIFSACDLAAP